MNDLYRKRRLEKGLERGEEGIVIGDGRIIRSLSLKTLPKTGAR